MGKNARQKAEEFVEMLEKAGLDPDKIAPKARGIAAEGVRSYIADEVNATLEAEKQCSRRIEEPVDHKTGNGFCTTNRITKDSAFPRYS
jgi:hypothetical protein